MEFDNGDQSRQDPPMRTATTSLWSARKTFVRTLFASMVLSAPAAPFAATFTVAARDRLSARDREGMRTPRKRLLAAISFMAAGGALLAPAVIHAATFQVTQQSDRAGICDSKCALREAIMAANATPDTDRVKLPAGKYRLSIASVNGNSGCAGDADFGDLDVCPEGGGFKLVGAGASRTVIDANQIDRVLHIKFDPSPIGNVRVSGVTLTGGRSTDEGGGLLVDQSRPTSITRSIIRGNRTTGSLGNGPDGGGISNSSTLTLKKTTVSGNSTGPGGDGGGIANPGTITIRDSAISGNVANDGGNDGDAGGLNNTGTATIVNSTFSGNRAGEANSSDGGALYNDGDLTLLNATIAFNEAESGGGLYSVGRPQNSQTIQNSILANNESAAGERDNCDGSGLVSLGHNLEQGMTCAFAGPKDKSGDAGLKALKDNGGLTRTHALGAESKAIDHGASSACPSKDQRGVRRPQGKRCDVGAYERK